MSKSRILPLLFSVCLLLTGVFARAQRLTNEAALRRAGLDLAQKEKDLHARLLSLARQNSWPLTLRNMKGRVAYLRGVDAAGAPVYISTDENIISAATIRTSQLWPGGSTGLALSGSSAVLTGKLAMWDEGDVRATHVELVGRVTNMDNLVISNHSTHVAGTLIASGVNPLVKGMSFGALSLLDGDFTNDVPEMFSNAANLLVSNHSYGDIAGWYQDATQGNRWEFFGSPGDTSDFKFGNYDKNVQLWDSVAYDAPHYLIFKAAGNNRNVNGPAVGQDYFRPNASGQMLDAGPRPANLSSNNGFNIIATEGCAKNIMTLGAVNPIPGGYSQPSDVVMTDFSSWGPTADGRIKPDVVADGMDVLSTYGTADNAYDYLSGTSMSTPAAAGSALLLQEYYAKLHSNVFMLSSTLKGLLIHTADEAGPFPGPDYVFGWGLINMQKAASVITSDNANPRDQVIMEGDLVNGSHDADNFPFVASGKTPLTATIAWIDPPAKPNATVHVDNSLKLVNDLDLRISDGVTTWKPWVLNPANPFAAATTGDNTRDNVEKIEVDSLIPGKSYTLTITHKGVLARGQQSYSLLVSGVGGQAYCASASGGAGGTRIDKVVLSNISNTNTAGCKSYSDFTGVAAARLPVGQTLPITVNYSVCDGSGPTNKVITVYIDFNNNGSFGDPGEMVAQSGVVNASSGVFSAAVTIPATASPGSYSRMRVIAEETSSTASVSPCGSYGQGETQDYRVLFTNPSADAGVTQLEYPTLTTCASDTQIVAVRIHNFGSTEQTSVPVTTVIKNGGSTVATLSGVCKDSIAPGSEVVFTYETPFSSVAGTTYTFTSSTSLPGDLNTANDQNITTLTVDAAQAAPTGTATICSTQSGSTQVALIANGGEDDIDFWYQNATGGNPIAVGNNTTTSIIPSNDTYYLGLNNLSTNKVAPLSNQAINSGAGSYFSLVGNYTSITTSVPLTIESARLYVGNSGKVTFTLATLINSSFANGYNYVPLYSTTIDVAATVSSPSPNTVNVAAGSNTDQGALYYLNIPIPVPGDYIIITDCGDNATLFLSQNGSALPYPFALPGLISVTGTYINDSNPGDSLTFPKKVYYPFYDMGIRLYGCSGARVPVVATTPSAPTIALTGDSLISSAVNGNQWYLAGTPIVGATNQIDTPVFTGAYKTVVSTGGCALSSNIINFSATGPPPGGNAIGLLTTPNPNNGSFTLQFYFSTQDDLTVSLIDLLGQTVYKADYGNFTGQFAKPVNAGYLASGMYVLKIQHGKDVYIQKILIKK